MPHTVSVTLPACAIVLRRCRSTVIFARLQDAWREGDGPAALLVRLIARKINTPPETIKAQAEDSHPDLGRDSWSG
jgi:hypothetical protein